MIFCKFHSADDVVFVFVFVLSVSPSRNRKSTCKNTAHPHVFVFVVCRSRNLSNVTVFQLFCTSCVHVTGVIASMHWSIVIIKEYYCSGDSSQNCHFVFEHDNELEGRVRVRKERNE